MDWWKGNHHLPHSQNPARMEEKLMKRGDGVVGRNDPCLCGSGKKYKKCCGREETVNLQQVIDTELDDILMEFIEVGIDPKELHQLTERVSKWLSVLSTSFGRQTIEILAIESLVFHDRSDIWRDFIEQKMKTHKRQRVLDVLMLWKEPFYLLAEVQKVEGNLLHVREQGTGEMYLMEEIGEEKPGEWFFGLVIPRLRDGKTVLQALQGMITILGTNQKLVQKLAARLKDGVNDSLELYQSFVGVTPDQDLSALQIEIMELVSGFVDDYGLENEAIEGIAFTFLKEAPLKARKPEGVAAGILQAASDFGLFEGVYVPRQVIAEKLGTSVGTLTKYADMVEEFVLERVDQPFGEADQVSPIIVTEMGTNPWMSEQPLWEMLMKTMNAGSEAEINKILQQENLEYTPKTDAERAQLLCYKAYVVEGKKRERLVRKALELDAKNVDANLLAVEYEEHPVAKRLRYLTALNVGYKTLDDSFETIWGYIPNRPFLRALFSYGAWLIRQGEYKEAIDQLTELMTMNPSDHQGAKWLLLSAYLHTGEWDKAGELTDDFSLEENTGIGMYFHYLSDLHTGILQPDEINEMKQFIKNRNPHLFAMLKKGDEPGAFPGHLVLQEGSIDEAKLVYWLIYGIEGVEKFSG